MSEMNLNWSDLQLFMYVARGDGLAKAAIQTGISAPTLGRHMVALERAYGEVLFDRYPRGYVLTDAGKSLFKEALQIEEQILNIESRKESALGNLPIQISAGTWMNMFLSKHVSQLQTQDVRLVFKRSESKLDLARREATIGIRNKRPMEKGLAARKIGQVAFAVYANEEAFQKQECWIASSAQTPSAQWVQENKGDKIKIEVSDPRQVLDLALQGAGHVLLPCFVADEHSQLKRVELVEELTHDQWLVMHGEDRHLPNVRKTINAIVKLLKKNGNAFLGNVSNA